MIIPAVPHDITLRPASYALAAFILIVSAFADLPRLLSTDAISGQGVLSIGYFCAGLLLLLTIPASGRVLAGHLVPFAIFVAWAATSLLWTRALVNGLQNLVVIGTMFMLMHVTDGATSLDPSLAFWVDRLVGYGAMLSGILYGVSLAIFGEGTNAIIGARSFGVVALFGVCHYLSRWRYGSRKGLILAIVITTLIGASQSRLALGVAVALFPLSQLPGARKARVVRMAVVAALVVAASFGALTYFDSLRERFVTGDVSLKIGSFAMNGSGRLSFWKLTLQSFGDAPFVGGGAGSTEGLIESVFLEIRHAHSDYLRILHDYGLIGTMVWFAAMGTLLFSLWRCWRVAERISVACARIHLNAILALSAFLLTMTMENALVYPFVAAPLALIVGSAFGLHRATLRTQARARRADEFRWAS